MVLEMVREDTLFEHYKVQLLGITIEYKNGKSSGHAIVGLISPDSKRYILDAGKGFTFDEYNKFLKETWEVKKIELMEQPVDVKKLENGPNLN